MGAFRLDGHDEFLGFAGLPRIHQMGVPPGAFIAKNGGMDPFPFRNELGLVVIRHLAPVFGIAAIASIPDGKNQAPLGGGIHLHAEVAAGETAGHVVGVDRIGHGGDFVIKQRHPGFLRNRVGKMHGSRIAPFLQVEMGLPRRVAVQMQGFDLSRIARSIQTGEFEAHVPRTGNGVAPKIRPARCDISLMFLIPDFELQP